MAITLNGSTGITSPGGDTSTSLSTGLLTVTGTTVPANGMYLPTTNTLAWATNSSEKLRLDSAGNLGLGVTPSGWGSGYRAVQLSAISMMSSSVNGNIVSNAYFNGTNWIYTNNAYATNYYSNYANNGSHVWSIAPSGTAGGTVSFTQAMTLDASGNLGIGTSTNNVYDGVAQPRPLLVQSSSSTTTAAASTNAIVICNSDTTTNNFSQINFASLTGGGNLNQYSAAYIACQYGARTAGQYPTGQLIFATSTSTNLAPNEKARIDSSGNLLVGTTSSLTSARLTAWSSTAVTAIEARVNAASSDSVGAITTVKNSTTNTTSQVHVQFTINGGAGGAGQINSNGASQAAFGSFSDARLKENITALPAQLANICALKPSEFDYKDGSGHQIGFIAQEMQEVYPDAVGEREDGMLTITGWSKTEARLVKAIQELTARLEALENK